MGDGTNNEGTSQDITRPDAHQKKRDWVGTLIIPITLVVLTALFSVFQLLISMRDSDQQHLLDTQLAQNQQHQDILVSYQKEISDLLLNQQLRKSNQGDTIRVVAQAKTLAALSALDQDGQRKGLIVQFLYEAQLIQTRHPIIGLNHADLNDANLSGVFLSGANLSGAIMRGVNLSNADLRRAYLESVDLENDMEGQSPKLTNLNGTNFSGAYLWNANLSGVDLTNATLHEPGPNGITLSADLSDAKLCGTNLGKHQSEPEVSLTRTIMTNCPTSPTSQSYPACQPQSTNLENDAVQWQNSFYNSDPNIKAQGTATENIVDEPNILDTTSNCINKALQISLLSGVPASYTGVQAYRNMPSQASCIGDTFHLSLFFYVTDVAPVQALAFSMQQWMNNQEWQWALQWQQNGNGIPPDWRIWKGAQWQDISRSVYFAGIISPNLTERTWHFIDLQGTIVKNHAVHYQSFTYDTHIVNFKDNDETFPLVSNPSSKDYTVIKLVPSIELNGNSQEGSYDVYIDNVSLTTSHSTGLCA